MKRTIFMLMTLVIGVIHPSANASSLLSCNDDKREIPIDVPKKKENPYSVIPLTCYYSASLLKVGIRFKRDIGRVALLVTNETTGESWSGLLDSSMGEGSLCISGTPGTYTVSIMLTDGCEYEGTFIL